MATSLLTTVENRSGVDAWAEAVHRPVQSVLQKRPELRTTLDELRSQRVQTAAEIEDAVVEEGRLQSEIDALRAELENLKARRAVAQTRAEATYVFDRSAFDKARDRITSIRVTIAEQNKRLDYFGRNPARRGLIPAETAAPEEDGAEAIADTGVPVVSLVTARDLGLVE